jgi:radical SAM protein with 4Fe4S-binding SPASM domain
MGTWRIHRAHGIILALCNGKRTISDIAHLTKTFVKENNEKTAYDCALINVKQFVYGMTKTREELKGLPPTNNQFPVDTVLVSKINYDDKFKDCKIPIVEYVPREFLPQDKSETAEEPFQVAHSEFPVSLTWHLTSDCATDCRYCYLKRRNVLPLPKSRILQLIKEAAEIGVCNIDCAGGDVLCYPYLFDVLEELCNYKFLPFLLSTKAFLSKDKAQSLAQFTEVIWNCQFSLDTDDPLIAEFLVGVQNFPKRMFESIDNALNAGLPVSVKAVVTPYNILTVPRLYRTLKSRGVQKINIATYSYSAYHHTDDLFNTHEGIQWLQDEITKLEQEFPDDNIVLQNGTPQLEPTPQDTLKLGWKDRIYCPAGHSSMMICADGKVIPCEQMPETDDFFCGDVSFQSIMEVWNGERLKEMTYGMPREKFQGKPCYDCEEREECLNIRGICIRDLAILYGDIYQPPLNCYRQKLPFIRQT